MAIKNAEGMALVGVRVNNQLDNVAQHFACFRGQNYLGLIATWRTERLYRP